jgi:rhodanese-related sulfurtransferase
MTLSRNTSLRTLLIILTLLSTNIFAKTRDISHEEFAKMRTSKPDLILLDVRTAREFADGHIEGAINIPHNNIRKIMQTVEKDDTVVLYCRSGRRVGLVTEFLEQRGYKNLHHLDGSMLKWWAEKKPVVKPN